MLQAIDIMLGRAGIPEGFDVAIGRRLTLTGAAAYSRFLLEANYWFILREVRAAWRQPTDPTSIPQIEIQRDYKNRVYQHGDKNSDAVDLRVLATPGEYVAGAQILRPVTDQGALFPPGSVIKANVSGFISTDPAKLDLTFLGRYVRKPEAR